MLIEPGKSFIMNKPGQDPKHLEIIQEINKLVIGASPFCHSMEFLNKTKHCTVEMVFSADKITVVFKNPEDEVFKLEEPVI